MLATVVLAGIPVPVTTSPTATWDPVPTLMMGLPLIVLVETFPVVVPMMVSLKPTLERDLIPNAAVPAVV